MPTLTPFLWFNGNAEEAAEFYVATCKQAKVLSVERAAGGGPWPAGRAMSVTLEVFGQRLIAFNGGPHFQFNEAISLFAQCDTQAEVDALWQGLCAGGGAPGRCGWLKDRYGVSWQVIPARLGALLGAKDPVRAQRVMQAMMKMDKIDGDVLQRAHDGDASGDDGGR